MKKILITISIISILLLAGCSNKEKGVSKMISAEEAKKIIDTEEVIIVDVRNFYEYEQSHIKGAINIPLSMIEENNPDMPDKKETILVYCQSGNRSKQAANKLKELGYQHIYDFGGIQNWTYEIETSI